MATDSEIDAALASLFADPSVLDLLPEALNVEDAEAIKSISELLEAARCVTYTLARVSISTNGEPLDRATMLNRRRNIVSRLLRLADPATTYLIDRQATVYFDNESKGVLDNFLDTQGRLRSAVLAELNK